MKIITRSTLLAACALSLAFASTVVAQDSMSSPQITEFSWTGYYAGIQGGAAFSTGEKGRLTFDTNLDGGYDDSIAAFGNSFDGSFDSEASYGAHLGYDYQLGPWVVGVLADINKVEISQRQSGFSSTPAFYHEERSIDTLGTVRARFGYLFTNRVLVYVTGGYAHAEEEYRMLSNTPATVATSGGGGDGGRTYGAGVETRITSTVSLGIEYLHYNLGDGDFVSNFSGPAAFSTIAASTNSRGSDRDFNFSQVQAKLSFRF